MGVLKHITLKGKKVRGKQRKPTFLGRLIVPVYENALLVKLNLFYTDLF